MHTTLAFSALPLFAGALLSDWAYAQTEQVQWTNFAAWLIAGGLLMAGLALLWGVVDTLRRRAAQRGSGWLPMMLLLAAFVIGVVNALVHAQDAWAAMPNGLVLSVGRLPARGRGLCHGPGRRTPEGGMTARRPWAPRIGAAAAAGAVTVAACAAWTAVAFAQQGKRFAATAVGPDAANPDLPPPQRGLLPKMKIANPAPWGDRRPVVPQGWTVSAVATELQIPRQTLVLPNGDILVAEGKGKSAPPAAPEGLHRRCHQIQGHDQGEGRRSADGCCATPTETASTKVAGSTPRT